MLDPFTLQGGFFLNATHVAADIKALVDAVEARGEMGGLAMHDILLTGAAGSQINLATIEEGFAYLAQKVRAGTVKVQLQSEFYDEVFA